MGFALLATRRLRLTAVLTVAALVVLAAGPALANVPLTRVSRDTFTNPTSQHQTEVEPDTFSFGSTIISTFHYALYATKLINQNEVARLRLTAPNTPGNYPFACTFPAHWRVMNGVMEVVKQ